MPTHAMPVIAGAPTPLHRPTANHLSGCENPIRLSGLLREVDSDGLVLRAEHASTYASCKTRRATRCEACAELYQHDARHLVASGLRGGKGVGEEVCQSPGLFLTLTAPSFGIVHTTRNGGRCHPRRDAQRCEHGTTLSCWTSHTVDEPALGQPLCADCYDYEGAVLWNNAAPALWRITRINIARQVANVLRLPERQAREQARSQFVKVAEFQRRGLVHFHVALRIDAEDAVADRFTADVLTHVVATAVRASSVARADGRRSTWGPQLDIRAINPQDTDDENVTGDVSRRQVANYLAKYSTKGSDIEGKLDRRFRCEDDLRYLAVNDHLARMVRTSWRLARRFTDARLDAWSHQLGFRGHFLTKSRGWSTTFKALRRARAAHQEQLRRASWSALHPESMVIARWSYAGIGHRTPHEALLAEAVRHTRRSSRAA